MCTKSMNIKLAITLKLLFVREDEALVGERKTWCEGNLVGGEFFLVGEWANDRLLGGLPPVRKTLLSLTKKQRRKTFFTILKI